ncbi:MAG: alpha/beta hydrolase [Pseudomonadota bacterium]|nr:alpha/beta hydrolase [Pseudomonadota bacterium]
MTRRGLTASIVGVFAAILAACSPLTVYNALGPRDPTARQAHDIAYGSMPRQKLDIYAPLQTGGAAPVLVFFHGGTWNSGRRQDYAFIGQALASRGFVTVIPDYRLVPEVRYPTFLQDGAAAVRWARDHAAEYGGDPRRIVLVGHSAGAYNAMMLALDGEFLKAVGVDPAAIKAVAGLSGPYNFLPLNVPWTIAAFSGYPDLPATQPINYASAASPPAFLAHGDKDTLVSPQNTIALGRKLEQAGATVEVKLYPGLHHPDTALALSRLYRSQAPVLDDMTAFLKAHAAE